MANDPDLRLRVNIPRSQVPAITHVDYSARIQTVDEERHGRLYRLLKMFDQHTGCPMLVNTSFNVRGEPIVCTPQDALKCFLATDMDLVVLGNFIVNKKQMTRLPSATEKAEHLAAFQPD
jgi:carbamoyltransferase